MLLVTPDERHLVSGGFDRTVRLWEAASGRQLFRWMMPGEDDRIFAMAISSDGQWLAVGGDIAGPGTEGAVHVLSLRNGQLVASIGGFHARVGALAFSPDSRHLAIGFAGNRDVSQPPTVDLANLIASAHEASNAIESGIAIVGTSDWQKLFSDPLSRGPVRGLAFNSAGSLVALAEEAPTLGTLAIYRRADGGYARQARGQGTALAGSRPTWSSDGKSVRVGGDALFNGETLAELETTPRPPGDDSVTTLRITGDGRRMAGALPSRSGGSTLRVFTGTHWRSSGTEFAVPDPGINDLALFADGRLAYAADNGSVGLIDASGSMVWRNSTTTFAFRNRPDALRLSADGEWVRLPYATATGSQEIAFHLASGRFAPVDGTADWQEPVTSRRGLGLLAWRNSANPTANGNYFPFRTTGERSLSAVVAAEENVFFYGTDGGRLYKATPWVAGGRWNNSRQSLMMWSRELGSDVEAVNTLGRRGLLLAATQDGVLRLLREKDGAVLVTYYLQPAERKWLAVAESGHYEASVGGEDLGGWLVNQDDGRLPAFFPMSRLRDQLLLPGMLRHLLSQADTAGGIAAALAENGRAPATPVALPTPAQGSSAALAEPAPAIAAPPVNRLPPSVEILAPGFAADVSQPTLTVRIRLHSPADAPVTSLQSRVVAAGHVSRGLPGKGGASERELTVALPAQDAEIHITAENRWGTSIPGVIRVRYTGQRTAQVTAGTLRIVAIGVSEYDNPRYRLGLPSKDAQDFGQLFANQTGRLYGKVELSLLTDRKADRGNVIRMLSSLVGKVRPEDSTFVFLAGHGVNDTAGGYYYLPKDADVERLADTAVSFRQIRKALAELPGRNILFVDTCHAGNALGSLRAGLSRDNTAAINEIASAENNIIVFASSSGEQESLELADWGNGAFTKALLEGLRGEADFKKRGRVTYKQLDAYVSDRVAELTEGRQTPVTPVLFSVPDFAIAEVRR